MKFNTAFAILVSLNFCLAASPNARHSEEHARIRNDMKKLISDARSRHAARSTALRDGEYDLLPSLEALMGMINLEAAIELINYESGCGAEMWEYFRGPEFELVIDDFWGEPGILAVLEFIATNGWEYVYDMVGLIHLLLGMKLPDLPYTERFQIAAAPVSKLPAAAPRAEDECTPEDQEAIAEIVSRIVPIWKMLDLILDILATDESFVALVMRLRDQDVIDSYHSFIMKPSAIDLGERMEAVGVPPKLILGILDIFFGLHEQP